VGDRGERKCVREREREIENESGVGSEIYLNNTYPVFQISTSMANWYIRYSYVIEKAKRILGDNGKNRIELLWILWL